MKNYVLEACVDSAESAFAAEAGGAVRLELCADLIVGGTTPSICLLKEIRKKSDIRIHVLIRPRFGDFCYTEHEANIIEEEIRMFKDAGADGIVTGALCPDGTLDCKKMERFVKAAEDRWVTLHRAFDVCADPYRTLDQARDLGISCILTSGQKNSALEGKDLLRELQKKAGETIQILAGGGICADVISELYRETGITSYHMSGKITLDSPMTYRKKDVSMGLSAFSEYQLFRTSKEKISDAKNVLENL